MAVGKNYEVPVSVRIPARLLQRIDDAAKEDQRTRSNLIVVVLTKWLNGRKKS